MLWMFKWNILRWLHRNSNELIVLFRLESVLPTESGPGFTSTSPHNTIRQYDQVENTVTVRANRRLRMNRWLRIGEMFTRL